MRLIDEMNGIKHASGLMQAKQLIVGVMTCLVAVCACAENNPLPTQATIGVGPAQTTSTPPADQTTNQLAAAANNSQPGGTRDTRALTLEECIRLALQHNLEIQIQRYNPIIDLYNVDLYYGVYEPVFNLTATKNYNDRPGSPGIDPQTGLPFTSSIGEADTYRPAIQGSLPTGLTYDLSGTWSRDSTLVGSPAHYAPPIWNASDPGPGISLTQPLLRNFWIDKNRLTIQLNKSQLKISEAALRLQIMTSITAVKSAYYNLLYARGNVEANTTAYKLAEQLVSENLRRVQVGALAPLDEKQSESQAAASMAAMQVAEQTRLTDENALKTLLTDHYSEWANVTLLPSEQLVAVPQELNLQESWRRAVTQRPELVEAKLNVEKQDVTLKYDFNQLFPELNVIGSYGRNSISTTLDRTFTDIERGNHSYYSYGAAVSIPLGGNYGARSQRKADQATLKQLLLTLKQVEQGIVVAVDNDVGAVRSTLQQVDATRNARIYAEDALAAERKKLENGKSTSFIVLQLISNLTTAKVAEVQALANYNIAVAQLALDEGSTLEVNHIDVNVK